MIEDISSLGKRFIENEEGRIDHVYFDQSGYQTIGVGHLLTKGERNSGKIIAGDIKIDFRGRRLKDWEIDIIFNHDIREAVSVVKRLKINDQHKFDALVSFVFNIGTDAFLGSTLFRLHKAGHDDFEIARQMKRWVKSNGMTLDDLVKRRDREASLFLNNRYGDC